ncbi:hypothetical protein [Homoserinibacter sp. GY 40078]|uniref:hypothetical protein n=1 Tax=Homoserinibacter sp. GY 40078 TaxID=2603275 RepID=UPI0011C78625|nr:hypothetical protein [Homoserinibacter sp. GY 40078]TXK19090.1 hypothetical protein FVQ89_03985 [Homoserinibacter sp. GY 40078]
MVALPGRPALVGSAQRSARARLRGRWALAALAALTAAILAGCATTAPAAPAAQPTDSDGDQWVVVTFGGRDEQFDLALMDSLLETELAADEALTAPGIGGIDGNEVGDGVYDLYFVGDDAGEMWDALEPVFAAAPVPWTTVELRSSLDDPAPRVLTREG